MSKAAHISKIKGWVVHRFNSNTVADFDATHFLFVILESKCDYAECRQKLKAALPKGQTNKFDYLITQYIKGYKLHCNTQLRGLIL